MIVEYRRYVFLAMTAGHPVTPSDQVDQAWHLHLLYTRSYWEELCGTVLGRPLHHTPSHGGPDERAKYRCLYEGTLASYVRVFGERPPADIWPAPSVRFGPARYRRIDVARSWVIPRPGMASAGGRVVLGMLVLLGIVVSWLAAGPLGGLLLLPALHGSAGQSIGPREAAVPPSFLVLLAAFVAIAVLAATFSNSCAACRKRRAMKKTGAEMGGSRWGQSTQEEWRCKYCGNTVWKTQSDGCCG